MKVKSIIVRTSWFAVLILVPVLFSCAHATGRKGDPATADEPFTSSEAPKNEAYYHFAASRMLFLDNNVEQSLVELELAEQADPSSAYLKYNLALVYMTIGKIPEALAKLQESIKTDPDFAPSFTLLGKIYASSQDPKEREQAVGILERAIQLDPDDAESLLFLGIMDTEAGNYDSAEARFKKITELYPDNEKSFFFLGKLYSEKGDYARAEENYKKALDIDPSFGSALVELALVYMTIGKIP
ncbi:MAG TPA: tetratricopeptide repeat protein, partial [Thermodesulfobacteriota bacterium]|nr:tetratricopeptide repeat protein [Thermodesulfobacteriota bacterium]